MCFDIDPHAELAERGAAHRADRSDERSAIRMSFLDSRIDIEAR